MSKIEQVKLSAVETQTTEKVEKFVETAPTVANVTPTGFVTSLPIHVQIEEDAQALLKKVQGAGIDFEIFLRGVWQRVEKKM